MSDDNKDTSQNTPAMDYEEHEKTFELFLLLTKWGTIITVALLLAMAFGFFAGGGLIGGTIAFVLLVIVSAFFA